MNYTEAEVKALGALLAEELGGVDDNLARTILSAGYVSPKRHRLLWLIDRATTRELVAMTKQAARNRNAWRSARRRAARLRRERDALRESAAHFEEEYDIAVAQLDVLDADHAEQIKAAVEDTRVRTLREAAEDGQLFLGDESDSYMAWQYLRQRADDCPPECKRNHREPSQHQRGRPS